MLTRDITIGAELHLSESTVKTHMQYLRDGLGMRTRTELAVWWARQQISENIALVMAEYLNKFKPFSVETIELSRVIKGALEEIRDPS